MRTVVIGLVVLAALSGSARAEMREFQLRRFLDFHTDCHMDEHVDRSAPTGPGLFHASCGNEWTCHILTKPRSFDSLDLLGHKREP